MILNDIFIVINLNIKMDFISSVISFVNYTNKATDGLLGGPDAIITNPRPERETEKIIFPGNGPFYRGPPHK